MPPLPEPVHLQIRKITDAAQSAPAPELEIINGPPGEARIRIMGIHDAPPIRARITEIIAIPRKD
jgi:hypothetical protein